MHSLRASVLQPIFSPLNRTSTACPCFLYATIIVTIITQKECDLESHLTLIQQTIAQIWQLHVKIAWLSFSIATHPPSKRFCVNNGIWWANFGHLSPPWGDDDLRKMWQGIGQLMPDCGHLSRLQTVDAETTRSKQSAIRRAAPFAEKPKFEYALQVVTCGLNNLRQSLCQWTGERLPPTHFGHRLCQSLRSEYCLADCLTKHSAAPDELIHAVAATGSLRNVDCHPPFRTMIKSKAFLTHWVMNNLKNVNCFLSVFAEPIRHVLRFSICRTRLEGKLSRSFSTCRCS